MESLNVTKESLKADGFTDDRAKSVLEDNDPQCTNDFDCQHVFRLGGQYTCRASGFKEPDYNGGLGIVGGYTPGIPVAYCHGPASACCTGGHKIPIIGVDTGDREEGDGLRTQNFTCGASDNNVAAFAFGGNSLYRNQYMDLADYGVCGDWVNDVEKFAGGMFCTDDEQYDREGTCTTPANWMFCQIDAECPTGGQCVQVCPDGTIYDAYKYTSKASVSTKSCPGKQTFGVCFKSNGDAIHP